MLADVVAAAPACSVHRQENYTRLWKMPSIIPDVAQIVAISPAVIVNGEMQLSQVSPLSHAYDTNAGGSCEAKFISLPFGAYIGSTLLRYRDESLVSVTVLSYSRPPTQLLHPLPEVPD